MLRYLKDILSTISIYLLSVIIILNILKYSRILLKLFPSLQIYRQPLDYPNLTYIVNLINKARFKYLDFLILSGGAIGKILKTIIFLDKTNNVI